ncbi:hypothetical protein [Blautia obeum]|uniref:hypothetical protein n=1 Tax=Blautia obeum TaxID=40520 RepID=UPI001FA8AD71|nr:hypothetical protein [Blautia obeum]
MAYVNYCEKEELANPHCQKLADLDFRVTEQDKAWYAEPCASVSAALLQSGRKRSAGVMGTADCRKTGRYGWSSQNN